jgi:hypothetical protein
LAPYTQLRVAHPSIRPPTRKIQADHLGHAAPLSISLAPNDEETIDRLRGPLCPNRSALLADVLLWAQAMPRQSLLALLKAGLAEPHVDGSVVRSFSIRPAARTWLDAMGATFGARKRSAVARVLVRSYLAERQTGRAQRDRAGVLARKVASLERALAAARAANRGRSRH